ncbi:MAG: (2Fe-2S)-binding protein [Bdellovibrionales bacterium]|nr:(2Fe-2S)-binding protein [Bdellovibrionales bacterium]
MGQKKNEIVCLCNNVSREVIEEAIRNGANTLNKIFDATTAGVGACGGSCRRKLQPLLEHYLKTGEFPEHLTGAARKNPRR